MIDLISEPTIGIYIDKFQCQECIVDAISEFQSQINYFLLFNSSIIITENYNNRELSLFINRNNLKIPTYSMCDVSSYLKKMQGIGKPFFFLMSPDMEISNILFSSSKTDSILNERYFSRIQKLMKSQLSANKKANDLIFLNPIINLGTIELKKQYTATFKIINIGKHPCSIISISTSCDCLIPAFDSSPIKPDSTRELCVTIYPTIKGEFSKSVTIKVDATESPFEQLWIKGHVN